MIYCDKCGNILLPKRNKKVLFCRVCNEEFSANENKEEFEKYKSGKTTKATKKLKDTRAYKTAVIVDDKKKTAISQEDREAYEDYFETDPGESEGFEGSSSGDS